MGERALATRMSGPASAPAADARFDARSEAPTSSSNWSAAEEQSWGIWKRVNSSFFPNQWKTSNQDAFAYDPSKVIPAAVYPGEFNRQRNDFTESGEAQAKA